jgi:hypothetical protein
MKNKTIDKSKYHARVLGSEDVEELRQKYGNYSDAYEGPQLAIVLGKAFPKEFAKPGQTQHVQADAAAACIVRPLSKAADDDFLRKAYLIRLEQKRYSVMAESREKEELRRWLSRVEHEFAHHLLIHVQCSRAWSQAEISALGLSCAGVPPEGLAVRIEQVPPPLGRQTGLDRVRLVFSG